MAVIELKIKEVAERRGINSPFALQRETGLNYAVCYRLWHSESKLIDLKTLAKICVAFQCEPKDLLTFVPDSKKKAR